MAAGAPLTSAAAGAGEGGLGSVGVPVAPEAVLYQVRSRDLVLSILRSSAVFWLCFIMLFGVLGAIWSREGLTLLTLLPVLLGAVGLIWSRFSTEFGFRAALSPDGIRSYAGLLETRSQTVPPGRVQAVRLRQGFFWRSKGWWRVDMNVAGSSGEDGIEKRVLLPVGSVEEALLAVWMVLPDLGIDDPRAVLSAALVGDGPDAGFVISPRRARWLDPLTWRRNGYVSTERALLMRRGRFNRTLVLIPHERMQSLGLDQGPIERRLRVASFAVHSTPGPVSLRLPHMDETEAAALLRDQAERARLARHRAGPEKWMQAMSRGELPDLPDGIVPVETVVPAEAGATTDAAVPGGMAATGRATAPSADTAPVEVEQRIAGTGGEGS